MGPYLLPLALLFIAFAAPSIAQKTAAGGDEETLVEVAEGAPLSVECVLGVAQRAAWLADGAAPAADLRAAGERALPGFDGRLVTRLHAARARLAHAALYTCAPQARPVRVRVIPAVSTEPTLTEASSPAVGAEPDTSNLAPALVRFVLGQRLEFDCKLPDPIRAQYSWYKNGSLIADLNSKSPRAPVTEQEGRVLVYRRAHEDDFGNYSCAVGGNAANAWEARAQPLARVPPNTNVVEGQKFSITCKLVGKPYPRVEWTYAHSEEEPGAALEPSPRRQLLDSAAGVPAGVLEVSEATRDDAGVYACVPFNGTASASTVRVKDVYAALWPFLGICLEVFILCAIILVYEKRRTKPELDDSDADTHDQ